MPSTSVHIPGELLVALDRAAKRRKVSRNRLIVDACRSLVGGGTQAWPEDFFAADRLERRDLEHLQASLEDWSATLSARRSKKKAPF